MIENKRVILAIGVVCLGVALAIGWDMFGSSTPAPQANIPAAPVIDRLPPAPAPPPKKPADLQVHPALLDLKAPHDGRPVEGSLTLRNAGEAEARIGLVRLAGSGDFRLSHDCPDPLPGGSGCSLKVTFTPLDRNSREAELVIVSGETNRTAKIVGHVDAPPPSAPAPSYQAPDPQLELIRELQRQRANAVEASLQSAAMAPEGELRRGPNSVSRRARDDEPALSQPDFGPDFPKHMASLPVNLDRVITNVQTFDVTLLDSLNSSVGGVVRAVLETDVFGDTGRLLLVPKGAIFRGEYQPMQRQGETRLPVTWHRIVLPGQRGHVVLEGQSKDAMGRTGIVGEVNSRLEERFMGAALFSLVPAIAAGVAGALDSGSTQVTDLRTGTMISTRPKDPLASGAASGAEELTRNLGAFTNQVIKEQFDLPPVMTAAQGTRFKIYARHDIWFPEPRPKSAVMASRVEQQTVQLGGGAMRGRRPAQPSGQGQGGSGEPYDWQQPSGPSAATAPPPVYGQGR